MKSDDTAALGAAYCSATALAESAAAWADLARKAYEASMKATSVGHYGMADSYRKTASEAFENEFRLRELPNASDQATASARPC
ncbi:MAG: hypothetical protein H7A54_19860 [Akkermansiaceae bacterium]|nr:hypothetical protein [Akkermansiaceae bacterium]